MDRHDVEPVVEILAERALLDRLFEVAVGRRDQADVDPEGLHPAHALEFGLLDRPQELHLGLLGDLADLVEEEGAAVGELEASRPRGDRPGEGAALVTEELALDEPAGDRGAVDPDKGLVGAGRAEVEGPRDQLLAGAALAGDQHGRRAGGDGADDLADRRDRRGAADHPGVDAGVAALRGAGRRGIRIVAGGGAGRKRGPRAGPGGAGLLDDLVDLIAIEGLLQVIEGAELDRLDRGVDGAVGGQEDDGEVRLLDGEGLEEADPVEVGHAQVGDDDVEGLRR